MFVKQQVVCCDFSVKSVFKTQADEGSVDVCEAARVWCDLWMHGIFKTSVDEETREAAGSVSGPA